jgi:nitroreductase
MFRKQDADYASKPDIKWNFTKFLVGRDGRVLRRYEPTDKMSLVGADIQAALNPVVANIMQRRSIRRYKDQPVEHEKLQTLVRCGINAPSGLNRQPWLLRVVEDQNLIGRVNDVFVKANPEQVKREPGFKNMFRNAPNIICVFTPTDGSGQLDAGLLTENILLAAQSMGLGTCCLGGPVRFLNTNPDARFFLEQMEVPSDYQLTLVIAVGYPDEQPEARPRDESKVKFITE